MPNRVNGIGPLNAKLMIVGEAPGRAEDETGTPFVGPSGEILDDLLSRSGISRSDVYITNVVKVRPPNNIWEALPSIGISVQEETQKLWEFEINKIQPNAILAVGDKALTALTAESGITNWRGSIIQGRDGIQKVVATLHPAVLFPHPGKPAWPWVWKRLIENDVRKAVRQSTFKGFNLPERTLTVAHSYHQVYKFFQEYRLCKKAANDIESINSIPVCTGFAFNKHHALSIPLLHKAGKNRLSDMTAHEVAQCWKLIQEVFSTGLGIIGHNYMYDEFKQNLLGFHEINCVSDTKLKVHTIFPELPDKDLATCLSLWTDEPFYKEEGKEPKFGLFNVEKFFKYNAKDCAATFELDEEMECSLQALEDKLHIPLRKFYYDYVMRKHGFYLRMANNGFRVDHRQKDILKGAYEYLREVAHEHLVSLIGTEINVKSAPQMKKLLYEDMGFTMPKKWTPNGQIDKDGATSEDQIINLINVHCRSGPNVNLKRSILEGILQERRIRDQISRALDFVPDYDGRCKTSVNIVGTETARTSTGVLKKPVRPKKIGLGFHTIPKHGRLARDIRSMFIPDEGFVFIQGDLSQAEARIVAVLAEDWELLKAFDIIDIHRRTAAIFFGYTKNLVLTPDFIKGVDDLEKDGAERYTGKTFRHAGNYDMGKHTAMVNYNTNAQKYEINTVISEYRAGEHIRKFHEASPNIRAVFHRDIRLALDSSRILINPYGRPREFNGKYEDDLYKEGFAQIPQSTVADTTQSAGISAWDEWGHDSRIAMFMSENHDALVAQVPLNGWRDYAKSLKRHMERDIDFSTYCTLRRNYTLRIPVDIEVSINPSTGRVTNYGELTKWTKIKEAA